MDNKRLSIDTEFSEKFTSDFVHVPRTTINRNTSKYSNRKDRIIHRYGHSIKDALPRPNFKKYREINS